MDRFPNNLQLVATPVGDDEGLPFVGIPKGASSRGTHRLSLLDFETSLDATTFDKFVEDASNPTGLLRALIVVDRSQSMGVAWPLLRNSFVALMKELREKAPSIVVDLAFFNHRSDLIFNVGSSVSVEEVFNRYKPENRTDFAEAHGLMAKWLTREEASQARSIVFFLSDGEHTVGEHDEEKSLEELRKVAATKSVVFHSIGFTRESDTKLLQYIRTAGQEAGLFYFVKKTDELASAVAEVVNAAASALVEVVPRLELGDEESVAPPLFYHPFGFRRQVVIPLKRDATGAHVRLSGSTLVLMSEDDEKKADDHDPLGRRNFFIRIGDTRFVVPGDATQWKAAPAASEPTDPRVTRAIVKAAVDIVLHRMTEEIVDRSCLSDWLLAIDAVVRKLDDAQERADWEAKTSNLRKQLASDDEGDRVQSHSRLGRGVTSTDGGHVLSQTDGALVGTL